MANCNIKEASIRCDDRAENLVFLKYKWDDGDCWYETFIEDAYCGNGEYTGLLGRIKRAWRALTAKPVTYAGLIIEDKNRAREFFTKCMAIIDEE